MLEYYDPQINYTDIELNPKDALKEFPKWIMEAQNLEWNFIVRVWQFSQGGSKIGIFKDSIYLRYDSGDIFQVKAAAWVQLAKVFKDNNVPFRRAPAAIS